MGRPPREQEAHSEGHSEVRVARCVADGTMSQELSGQKLQMISVIGFLYERARETLHKELPRLSQTSPAIRKVPPHNFPAPGLSPWENLPAGKAPDTAIQPSVVSAKFHEQKPPI